MCDKKPCCEKPTNMKGTPEECPPEQTRKCHGVSGKHPYAPTPDNEGPPAHSEGGSCEGEYNGA